jgi:GTP-binding protein
VPVGTIVFNAEGARRTDEEGGKRPTLNAQRSTSSAEALDGSADPSTINHQPSTLVPLADLTIDGQEFVLCRGGGGGKGNVHFKSSRNRAPREYTEGEEGEQGHFLLELRTIADAGLVGYPNAGKSTLLGKISAAHPKVAPYPFTTLHPIIGVVEFPGYRRATIADVPGLIEGAHRNVGLGHDFLRHITRCRLLLFVVDVAGSEGRSPMRDLENLRREIDLYDPRLSQRRWAVIANKMDLSNASENLEALRKRFPSVEIASVSAMTGEGIDEIKRKLAEWLSEEAGAALAVAER